MKCPHCNEGFHYSPHQTLVAADPKGMIGWMIEDAECPECGNLILILKKGSLVPGKPMGGPSIVDPSVYRIVEPPGATRPVAPEVPADIGSEYLQAAATLEISPMASAAISRRCLQHVIRTALGIHKGSLEQEIREVISGGRISAALAGQLNAVRQIGNFAAHPTKDTTTGAVLDVEPGEAEWNLDVLDGLFEELYVQPSHIAARTAALNKKLKSAGKPAI